MALNLIWTWLTAYCHTESAPVCRCSQLSRFIPTRTSQQDKHTILRGTFQCSFLMGNKSVSTGVDDTRGTPQGAHPFCCGHQGQGSFHRFHYSYLIRVRHPLLRHQVTPAFPAAHIQILGKLRRMLTYISWCPVSKTLK